MKMKHFSPFEWTGETFESRVGEPEELDAALGKLVMNFSHLDQTLDRLIRYLLALQSGRPTVNLATLSFARKVDVLATTVSDLQDILPFNTGHASTAEFFGELRQQCLQAEALYRYILTVRWGHSRENGSVEILDPEDSESYQHQRLIGMIDAHLLLDIADFICVVENDLGEFFLDPGKFIPETA